MSVTKPLITVLMPCYNAMPFLVEALESIIHQTYTNLEILCINDGSSDETGQVLDRYAVRDSRIKVVHNETNIKLIKSLNKGITFAKGEYIARMDADDIAAPERIKTQLEFMLVNPEVDIISCGLWVISEAGKVISEVIPRQHSAVSCFFASFFFVPIGHPELLAKAKVFKDNLFMDEEHAIHTEDYELWSRLLRKGYNLQNMDTLLHYFRINSQSVSRKYTKIQDENFVKCARKHYSEYTGLDYPKNIVKVLVNRIDHELSYADFKGGLNAMKKFKQEFSEKERIRIDQQSKREIQVVYYTQLFDICFQVFKRASFACKFYALLALVFNSGMLFHKGVRTYLKSKLV